jgi:hypothetical protein
MDTMTGVFDAAFLGWWNERRQVRHIRAVAHISGNQKKKIVPSGSKKAPTSHPFTAPFDVCVQLPSSQTVKMAMLLYDAKVAFISSTNEAFGFIVESGEFATLQKTLFTAA